MTRGSGAAVALAIGLGWVLPGCRGPSAADQRVRPAARTPEVTRRAEVEPESARAPLVISPGAASYLGDDPQRPTNAAENRLVTNATQHTFSTVGRDFDPDVHPTDAQLVFASTRHNEQPDIYLKAMDGYAMTQLIADPAADIQPRFSPDGKRVAFCSDRAGNWDIWVVDADGANLVQLTRERNDEVAPCWSPDGRQIAYTTWGQRSRQWEIWTLSVDEPGVKRFLIYGMFPDWSPDGKRLTFQRARQRGTRWFSVWTVELAGDDVRHPTEVAYSPESACIAPRWAGDSGRIVYTEVAETGVGRAVDRGGELEATIWTVDAARGVRRRLTAGGVSAFNPVWAPDGRVFFVSAQAGAENVWSVRPDSGALPSEGGAGG